MTSQSRFDVSFEIILKFREFFFILDLQAIDQKKKTSLKTETRKHIG